MPTAYRLYPTRKYEHVKFNDEASAARWLNFNRKQCPQCALFIDDALHEAGEVPFDEIESFQESVRETIAIQNDPELMAQIEESRNSGDRQFISLDELKAALALDDEEDPDVGFYDYLPGGIW